MNKEDDKKLIVPEEFNEVANKSLVKDLQDLLEGVNIQVMTDEEQETWHCLARRLASAAKSYVESFRMRSAMAEQFYDIQQEEGFLLLKHPETHEPYKNWMEFREILADTFGISTITVSRYTRMVRYARQVLHFKPGRFANENGLVHMKHMLDVSGGLDGRREGDWGDTVRPRTADFRERLDAEYPDREPRDQLELYYEHNVMPDYEDPSAVIKTPAELGAQAKQVTGAPDIWSARIWEGNRTVGYEIHLRYPDSVDHVNGEIILGSEEVYIIKYEDNFVPSVLLEWMSGRLGS